jgi:hypothetical protein
VGMEADLVVLRRNPVEDLSALRKVEYVVKSGCIARPPDIRLPSGDEMGESEPWFHPPDSSPDGPVAP